MAEIVRMPKLSDTMTEGVVSKWHKKVGEKVAAGDLLAEIETDKATMDFESFQDGVLLHIGVEEGKGAPVNSILAILGKEGEDISGLLSGESKAEAATKTDKAPEEAEKAQAAPKETSAATAEVLEPAKTESADARLKASPLAKKIAEDKGIDIMQVQGSGDGGRIVKRDVEQFTPAAAAQAKTTTTPAVFGKESFTEEAVSQMRRTIARRLAESKFSAPHFYLTIEIDMENAMGARTAINASGELKVSFNDFVVKAASMALRKHPKINSSWLGDKIRYNQHINIGVAMAVDEGLLVPVVRFADHKSLSQISEEVKAYSVKAKAKKLQPSDWEGNTFTISNLGMFDIDEFTAIINPPDACILAIGSIQSKPVVKDNQVVPSNIMKVTLSCDHRVVDGVTGAQFLSTFKEYLEHPVKMLA
jgi:pyruvate dehydrogenase E2 component (dihydrolipoamide acetyltransferase)